MKAVILAGGLGSRISEETDVKPKPMVEIGGKPILWHIMKMYSHNGIYDFVICCGYKGYVIKEYFANYFLHQSDVTFHMQENRMEVHDARVDPWTVTLVDTGDDAMTGGRLARIREYVKDDDAFCMTYGDGVSDVNIAESIDFHFAQERLATVTAVSPPGRFGSLTIEGTGVSTFQEKPLGDGGVINGGFFVLSPEVLALIDGPQCVWEKEPMLSLAEQGQLSGFVHEGFWHPMDTLRDKNYLEELWQSGAAPWKSWE
jgi:glucose-1-phosphate cytidylyltransferase